VRPWRNGNACCGCTTLHFRAKWLRGGGHRRESQPSFAEQLPAAPRESKRSCRTTPSPLPLFLSRNSRRAKKFPSDSAALSAKGRAVSRLPPGAKRLTFGKLSRVFVFASLVGLESAELPFLARNRYPRTDPRSMARANRERSTGSGAGDVASDSRTHNGGERRVLIAGGGDLEANAGWLLTQPAKRGASSSAALRVYARGFAEMRSHSRRGARSERY